MSGWTIALIACGGCLAVGLILAAVLGVVLFPVMAKARESARKAACMSNMKQLSLACKMYAQDWDYKYPSGVKGGSDREFETKLGPASTSGRATAWAEATNRYRPRAGTDLFRCPSDSSAKGQDISYYYKHAVNLAGQAGLKESDFTYPSEQMLLYERRSFHWGGGPIQNGATLNAAFLDSHVAMITIVDVAPDREPEYFNVVYTSNPTAAKVTRPYWDPRYCFDKL